MKRNTVVSGHCRATRWSESGLEARRNAIFCTVEGTSGRTGNSGRLVIRRTDGLWHTAVIQGEALWQWQFAQNSTATFDDATVVQWSSAVIALIEWHCLSAQIAALYSGLFKFALWRTVRQRRPSLPACPQQRVNGECDRRPYTLALFWRRGVFSVRAR